MSTVAEIETAVSKLPPEELATFQKWFAAFQAQPTKQATWAQANAFREKLAASGRTFSDSAELLREDRDR